MKNKSIVYSIATILSIFIINYNGLAQVKRLVDVKNLKAIEPNMRIVDTSLDKFTGTWLYQSGDEQLTIILNKIAPNLGSSSKRIEMELLNGGYKYIGGQAN